MGTFVPTIEKKRHNGDIEMKIGIMVLRIGSFGARGFCNHQEIGLAKALDSLCDEVKVYKLVSISEKKLNQSIEGTRHSTIYYLPSKSIGSNGIPDMRYIDKALDEIGRAHV